MFKYSTSTLVNGLNYVNGKPAWFVNTKGSADMKQNGTVVDSHESADDAVEDSFVLVQKEKFTKDAVVAVSRAKYVEPSNAQMTVDLSKMTDLTFESGDVIRLFIYIRTANAADAMYANDFVYKGRPLFIEAKAGASAEDAAKNLKKAANKWINLLWGEGNIVKVSVDGAKLTIDARDCEQRFHYAEVQEFDPKANTWAWDGAFVTKASSDEDNDAYVEDAFDLTTTPGNMGFCTYAQILKDLRLPTNANTRFYRDQVDEMPILSGKYWQYVVTICSERPEMQGTSVLGQYNKSVTSHIMFVEDAVKEAFEKDLLSVLTDTTLEKEDHANSDIEIYSWVKE